MRHTLAMQCVLGKQSKRVDGAELANLGGRPVQVQELDWTVPHGAVLAEEGHRVLTRVQAPGLSHGVGRCSNTQPC